MPRRNWAPCCNYWSPHVLQPMLCSERSCHSEKPVHHSEEQPCSPRLEEAQRQQQRSSAATPPPHQLIITTTIEKEGRALVDKAFRFYLSDFWPRRFYFGMFLSSWSFPHISLAETSSYYHPSSKRWLTYDSSPEDGFPLSTGKVWILFTGKKIDKWIFGKLIIVSHSKRHKN